MMKKMNKKGFTLIELLAIIVILAIIAVITVPIILNVIDNAKKGAAKNSVIGYGKAIELAYTQYQYDTQLNGVGSYEATGTTTQSVDVTGGTAITLGVNYDGDDVTGCTATMTNGKLVLEGCKVPSYSDSVTFKYDAGKAIEQ